MSDADKAHQATPDATLAEQIMNPCVPKNEREWWAHHEIERLRAALAPFAGVLGGNWSHQPDSLPIVAGYGAHDLRLRFTLGDFRRARAAFIAKPAEGEKA
ncbi:MAG: hypothetical protein RLZZ09_1102 [Pseudomonadota bacterium]|jgi:hypothetical protein